MLPSKASQQLKEIIARDYGVAISDDQAQELGVSLLRLTRVGLAALARANDQKVARSGEGESSLEPKTST